MSTEPETAAQLIDALLTEGEEVDAGSFTIDHRAAGTKLAAYQYTDRSAYLLPLFEGLVRLGARNINIVTRGSDLILGAEGVTLDEPFTGLASLGIRVIGGAASARDRALARLGIALDMVLGNEGLVRAVFSYDTGEFQCIAEHRQDGEPRLARGPSCVPGELRVLLDYAGFSREHESELQHLRLAAGRGRIPVFLNDEQFNQEPFHWTGRVEGEGPGFRYEAAESGGKALVELWSGGLMMEVHELPGTGFVSRLHLEAPRRDLSQMKLLHDETIEAGIARMTELRVQLVRDREVEAREKMARKEEQEHRRREHLDEVNQQFAQELEEQRKQDEALQRDIDLRFPRDKRALGIAGYVVAFCSGLKGFELLREGNQLGWLLVVLMLVLGIPGAWLISWISAKGPEKTFHWFIFAGIAAWFLSRILTA